MAVAAQQVPKGAAQTGRLSPARPVAGYLRSATELDGESLRKQLEAVLRYALNRDMQLIRIYYDERGNGLRIDNPPLGCGAKTGIRSIVTMLYSLGTKPLRLSGRDTRWQRSWALLVRTISGGENDCRPVSRNSVKA